MTRDSTRLRAYMSGPLLDVPPEAKAAVIDRCELIQEVCEDQHYSCFCSHEYIDAEGDPELTPGGIRRRIAADLREIELVIADCSLPSSEVEIACQMASERGIPVLIVALQGAAVSPLLSGLPSVIRFGGEADIVRFADDVALSHRLRSQLQILKEKLMDARRRRAAEIVSLDALTEYARSRSIPRARFERLSSMVAAAVRGRLPRSVDEWAALDREIG